jgi:hypothetical protein
MGDDAAASRASDTAEGDVGNVKAVLALTIGDTATTRLELDVSVEALVAPGVTAVNVDRASLLLAAVKSVGESLLARLVTLPPAAVGAALVLVAITLGRLGAVATAALLLGVPVGAVRLAGPRSEGKATTLAAVAEGVPVPAVGGARAAVGAVGLGRGLVVGAAQASTLRPEVAGLASVGVRDTLRAALVEVAALAAVAGGLDGGRDAPKPSACMSSLI